MKLSDYMEIVRMVILEHDTEGQLQAIIGNDPKVKEGYDELKKTLINSIRAHHSILELHERREDEEPYTQEVDTRALSKHLALVRQDLLNSIKTDHIDSGLHREAVQHLIGGIISKTGIDIGQPGSKTEHNVTDQHPSQNSEDMEAILEKLRREGKIL